MTAAQRYTTVAILLHWLIALGIIAMFALGWYMNGLPKDSSKHLSFDLFELGLYTWQAEEPVSARTLYFNLHKSLGFTLLWLVACRIYWRIRHTPPAMLASYTRWERRLATGTHHLMYLLMVVLPVSGVLMTLYSKFGLSWFGLKVFDGLDQPDLRDAFKAAHIFFAYFMLMVFILHVTAALKHSVMDKDGTMSRMRLK